MRSRRLALLTTASIGLMTIVGSASAQVVATPDGHYYRMVPVKRPASGTAPEMINVIPDQAIASVAPVSNCRLVNFGAGGQYQPQYTTVCGAP